MTTQAATAKTVDAFASEIMNLAERLAPMDSEFAQAGTEALLLALIRRVGPFVYTSNLTELIPASRS